MCGDRAPVRTLDSPDPHFKEVSGSKYTILDRQSFEDVYPATCFCGFGHSTKLYVQFLVSDNVEKELFFVEFHACDYSNEFYSVPEWKYISTDSEEEDGSPHLYGTALVSYLESLSIRKEYDLFKYVGYDRYYPGYRETYEYAKTQEDQPSDDVWVSRDVVGLKYQIFA